MRGEAGLAIAILGGVIVAGFSACDSFPYLEEYKGAHVVPKVLEQEKITLVTTPFKANPPTYFSSRQQYEVEFRFDPGLVRLSKVLSYALWRQDRPGADWQKIQTVLVDETPMVCSFLTEGAYGLRASAIYKDGREVCVPTKDDVPLVWLYVDRTAPKLSWFLPAPGEALQRNSRVELRWGVSEMGFGAREMQAEYSVDGGETWYVISSLPASSGEHSTVWKTPHILDTQCLLRVRASDLVGNEGTATIEVLFGDGAFDRSPSLSSSSTARGAPASAALTTEVMGPPEAPAVSVEPAMVSYPSEEPAQAREANRRPRAVSEVGSLGDHAQRAAVVLRNFNDGAVYRGGVTRYIFFQTEGFDLGSAKVVAEWREGSDGSWNRLGQPDSARSGKALWQLPQRSIEQVTLRLTVVDGDGRKATASISEAISIDHDPPVANARGFQRQSDGSLVLLLDCYDRGPAGLEKTFLYLTYDGGESWQEEPLEEGSKAIRLPQTDRPVGVFLRAIDRVGWDSGAPEPGSKPQKVLEVGGRVRVEIDDPKREVLKGGDEFTLTWRFEGEEKPTTAVNLEVSPNGVTDWELLAKAALAAERALVILPLQDGDSYVLRVGGRLSDGTFLDSRTQRFAIDSSSPQLEIGRVPARSRSELVFPLSVTDPGPAKLVGVDVYLRKSGERSWKQVPGQRLKMVNGQATLQLVDFAEGRWEIYLTANDSVGNQLPRPNEDSLAQAAFTLDKTPPTLLVKPTAFPWVEGMLAAVEIEIERGDVSGPLILEGRETDGEWQEIYRWRSLPPGQDLFRFRIPPGRSEYSVRFSIRDSVGNLSYAVLPPRPVQRSIELLTFDQGGSYFAGSNQPIRWRLHPALEEIEDHLQVDVSSRRGEGKPWQQIYDGLEVKSSCVWTLPNSNETGCSIRLRLFDRGLLVGMTESGKPFEIRTSQTDPKVLHRQSIQALSLKDSNRATLQMQMFAQMQEEYQDLYNRVIRSLKLKHDPQGVLLPQEEEKIPVETRRQLAMRRQQLDATANGIQKNYRDALEKDPQNYHATYGLARMSRLREPSQIAKCVYWLERTRQIKPDHVRMLNDLGASYIQMQDYRQAELLLKEAFSKTDRADIRFNLALALFYQNKTDEARHHLTALVKNGSPSIRPEEVYYYLIAAYVKDERLLEARQLFAAHKSQLSDGYRKSLEEAIDRAGP